MALISPDAGSDLDEFDISAEEELLLCQLVEQVPFSGDLTLGTASGIESNHSFSPRLLLGAKREPDGEDSAGSNAAQGHGYPADQCAVSPEQSSTGPTESTGADILPECKTSTLPKPPPAKPPDEAAYDSDQGVSSTTIFQDDRSPLLRFRKYPRKPFSVTDLMSGGAWCELQYYYTLTRLPFGRKTRNAVMKQGSKVHKTLEDQVHTTVRIDVGTKEDAFALKLWNVVQGLRTLRETGLTRELEVWGMVDGNLVTGIVDSLSFAPPGKDEDEDEAEHDATAPNATLDEKQHTLDEFFSSSPVVPPPNTVPRQDRKVYLADVKTRGAAYPPRGESLVRPAKIQLSLYYRFLTQMIQGEVDFHHVLRRLGLDADDTFTDEFMAQIGGIHDDVFNDSPLHPDSQQPSEPSSQTSASSEITPTSTSSDEDLLQYRTLRSLLPLVASELALTFPHGRASLATTLTVLYIQRDTGAEVGRNVFTMDEDALDAQLASDMEWWTGERAARGVEIEDAWKCRTCEFVEGCEWRRGLDEGRLRRVRERMGRR